MVYWHIETDYVALMIYVVLFVKAVVLNREKDFTDKVFSLSLVLGFVSTLIDIFSSAMMNELLDWWVYQISMIVYGLSVPVLALLWFLYTVSLIFREDELRTRRYIVLFGAIYTVYAAIIVTNPIHELYFHLTADMVYSRGDLFIPLIVWSQTLMGALGILVLLVNWRQIRPRSTALLLLLLYIITAGVYYVQIANPGWLIVCSTYAVAFLVCDATFESRRRSDLYDRLKQSLDQLQEDQTRELAYQKQLETAVRDAESAMREAKLASQAKSEFLSRMSHDIRTPMNGIRGMLEIIRRERDDQERVDDCLNKIEIASGHLLSLINNVLDMSKLESDQVTLASKPFDLRDVIRECTAIAAPLAVERGVILTFTGDDAIGHPYLLGSPLHLRQVICNILGNGIKYNRSGGTVTWSVEELPGDDEQHVRYRFVVQDTGIGISEEFLPRLFQPFAQEHGGSRTHYEGTGLGLAIVKRIVEAMDGEITAESKVRVGSTFTFTLPFQLDPAPEGAGSQEEDAAPPRLDGIRLLVVEDNELNMEIARFLLEDAGAAVDAAVNGQEAVDAFRTSEPGAYQAILMDVMMPVMNGLDAARAIRELDRPDAGSIPIIAMTANAFTEDAVKCREAGMDAHLAKPLDPPLMIRTLHSFIGK